MNKLIIVLVLIAFVAAERQHEYESSIDGFKKVVCDLTTGFGKGFGGSKCNTRGQLSCDAIVNFVQGWIDTFSGGGWNAFVNEVLMNIWNYIVSCFKIFFFDCHVWMHFYNWFRNIANIGNHWKTHAADIGMAWVNGWKMLFQGKFYDFGYNIGNFFNMVLQNKMQSWD
jgi:hypothetical protein